MTFEVVRFVMLILWLVMFSVIIWQNHSYTKRRRELFEEMQRASRRMKLLEVDMMASIEEHKKRSKKK